MLAGGYAPLVTQAGSSDSLLPWEEKDWKRLSVSKRVKILDEHPIHKDKEAFTPHPVSKTSNPLHLLIPNGSVYYQRLDKFGRAIYERNTSSICTSFSHVHLQVIANGMKSPIHSTLYLADMIKLKRLK